jgi:DNA modification methylase
LAHPVIAACRIAVSKTCPVAPAKETVSVKMKKRLRLKSELWQGDCLELMKNIPDHSIDFICCDLPYGVTNRNKWDLCIPVKSLWFQYKRVLKPTGAVALFGMQPFSSNLVMSNLEWFRYEWVWVKNNGTGFLNAEKRPLVSHENISIFSPNPPAYYPLNVVLKAPGAVKVTGDSKNYGEQASGFVKSNGTGYPRSVLEFDCERTGLHPTQKPVPLIEYLVKTYTKPNQLVLDNCMGSGTTGVACAKTGRRFIGIEKDEEIFKTAEKRIRFTEQTGIVVGRESKQTGFWKK